MPRPCNNLVCFRPTNCHLNWREVEAAAIAARIGQKLEYADGIPLELETPRRGVTDFPQ